MSLLYMCGFDEQALDRNVVLIGATPPTYVGGRRAGGSALHMVGSPCTLGFPITAAGTVITGFGFRANNMTSKVVQLMSAGTVQLDVRPNSVTGALELRRGATLIATSAQTATWGDLNWRHVQVKAVISDSAGSVIVKVNNVEWINFAGDTSNGPGTVDQVKFEGNPSASGSYCEIDDLVIMDAAGATLNDFQGDLAVETVLPTGNGATNAWNGSDGNSVDNYLLVDEPGAPSAADYVAAAAAQGRELYALPSLPTPAATLLAVQPVYQLVASDAGTSPTVRAVARDAAGVVVTGPNMSPGVTSEQFAGPILTAAPNGSAWSPLAFDDLQIGLETNP